MQNTNQAQKEPCCENQCSTCKCKVPMIIGCVVFSLAMLALGIFLGKTFFSASSKENSSILGTPTVSVVPTTTESTTGASLANWKTYKNNDIIFQYPQDWEIEKPQIFGFRTETDFKYKSTSLFTFSTIGNYNQINGKKYSSLDEYLGDALVKKATVIIVNNQPAKIVIDDGNPGHVIAFKQVVLFTPDTSTIISLYYSWPYYEKNSDGLIFNQILSTFKFTK